MLGNNTLHLNHDTVIEALQEYFDRRTTPEGRFKVISISAGDSQLEVHTEEPEDEDA